MNSKTLTLITLPSYRKNAEYSLRDSLLLVLVKRSQGFSYLGRLAPTPPKYDGQAKVGSSEFIKVASYTNDELLL